MNGDSKHLSPEEWDESDIITDLKAGIPLPGQKIPGVCDYHSSLARGQIYMIRHMAKGNQQSHGGGALAKEDVKVNILGIMKLSAPTAKAMKSILLVCVLGTVVLVLTLSFSQLRGAQKEIQKEVVALLKGATNGLHRTP